MAVATTAVAAAYAGNGAQTQFNYPNYLRAAADLVVTTTVDGVTTLGTLNGAGPYDFTFAGVADIYGSYPTGGTITVNNAPPAPVGGVDTASNVLLTRLTPKVQPVNFIDNSTPATAFEHALDRLTLILQESFQIIGVAVATPTVAGLQGQVIVNIAAGPGDNAYWFCTQSGAAGAAVWLPFGGISL